MSIRRRVLAGQSGEGALVERRAISEGVRGYALGSENAEALWRKSEEIVEEQFA